MLLIPAHSLVPPLGESRFQTWSDQLGCRRAGDPPLQAISVASVRLSQLNVQVSVGYWAATTALVLLKIGLHRIRPILQFRSLLIELTSPGFPTIESTVPVAIIFRSHNVTALPIPRLASARSGRRNLIATS